MSKKSRLETGAKVSCRPGNVQVGRLIFRLGLVIVLVFFSWKRGGIFCRYGETGNTTLASTAVMWVQCSSHQQMENVSPSRSSCMYCFCFSISPKPPQVSVDRFLDAELQKTRLKTGWWKPDGLMGFADSKALIYVLPGGRGYPPSPPAVRRYMHPINSRLLAWPFIWTCPHNSDFKKRI